MYFLRHFWDQGQALLRIRHDLMPRMLEIAFKSFQISNFFLGACPQTPLAKGALWPLVNTVTYSTLPKLAAYFKIYWNPCFSVDFRGI